MKVNQVTTENGKFYSALSPDDLERLLAMNGIIDYKINEVSKIEVRAKYYRENSKKMKSIYVDTYDEMRKTIDMLIDYDITHIIEIYVNL